MFSRRFRYWAILLLSIGVLLSGWIGETIGGPAKTPIPITHPIGTRFTVEFFQKQAFENSTAKQVLSKAIKRAEETAGLTQTARSAEEWDEVARGWAAAISLMQSLPVGAPQRVFAQRKAREYVNNLIVAQQRAAATSFPRIYPSLGSQILDEQLVVYLSYLATVGVPDVLIIGSSRSLQGIDPQILQQALAAEGYAGLKVFNLGVNGATAQVVDFILQRLLSPEQLPKLIFMGGGLSGVKQWPPRSHLYQHSRLSRLSQPASWNPTYPRTSTSLGVAPINRDINCAPVIEFHQRLWVFAD